MGQRMPEGEGQAAAPEVDTKTFKTLLEQGKHREAKFLLRAGHVSDKPGVWKAILDSYTRDSPVDTSSIYWDTVDTCFGGRSIADCADKTPGCVDTNHTPSYGLDKIGRAQVCRLVTCIAYNCPDVPYCPLLFPVAALLREVLEELDCYSFLSLMVSPPVPGPVYLTQSRRSWDLAAATLKPLALQYIKKHISYLERECGREQLDQLLTTWPWWIFEHVPHSLTWMAFESFLLEGQKVLYRTAMALVKAFSRELSRPCSQLYNRLKQTGRLEPEFVQWCSQLTPSSHAVIMRSAFKIPRFGKADLQKIQLKLEMEFKANGRMKGDNARRRSNEELLPNSAAIQDILAVSDTLTYKQLMKLWQHIPERITMVAPKLVFSSNNDGTSLLTFYNRVERYEPTLLIIKTTQGDIFGAYCSTAWHVRKETDDKGMRQRYFGTGESFLFRVEGDGEMSVYHWTGGQQHNPDQKGDHAAELFMSGDPTMITVGGGDGTGLYLDANLEFGRTETCRTFNNPPLTANKDFTVSVLEVVGFGTPDD